MKMTPSEINKEDDARHLGKGCPSSWERLPVILREAARHLGRGCPSSWEKICISRNKAGDRGRKKERTLSRPLFPIVCNSVCSGLICSTYIPK